MAVMLKKLICIRSIVTQLIHLHILNEDINGSNLSLQSNYLYKKKEVNMSLIT